MNEGITISGRNVSITFIGIGPVESYFCRIDGSPFLPCKFDKFLTRSCGYNHSMLTSMITNTGSSPVEYSNLEHGIHTVRVKSQKCGDNDKRLSFKITI